MEQLPSGPGWLTYISIIIMGIFATINLVEKLFSKKRQEQDMADDRLINILQNTVNNLEKEVGKLRDENKQNLIEMAKVTEANGLMKDILSGRDKDTIEFQKQGFAAIKRSEEILMVVKNTNDNMQRLTSAIEKHLQSIEKSVSN